MPSVLHDLARGSRVAVIRLRSLGDCVLTTPALALLKQARPDLAVAVVVEDRFREIFEGNPDVASILPPSVARLRGWGAELCVNLHGGTRSALLTALCGAPWRAGFGHYRHRRPYNIRIPRAQEILGEERKVHTAEHLASAVFFLGVPRAEIPRARLVAPAEPGLPAAPYAVIHPLASAPAKTWPAGRFLEVAAHLERACGLAPLFIGGPGEDLSRFSRYPAFSGAPIRRIKALLSGAALFVGNDSGPAHMAAAFGLPVVVLFGASDPGIWRPWKTPSEVLAGDGSTASIAAGDVISALERLRVHA